VMEGVGGSGYQVGQVSQGGNKYLHQLQIKWGYTLLVVDSMQP